MDFDFGASADALRAELRSLIASRVRRLPRRIHRRPQRSGDRATVLRGSHRSTSSRSRGRWFRRARWLPCGIRPSSARRCGRTTTRHGAWVSTGWVRRSWRSAPTSRRRSTFPPSLRAPSSGAKGSASRTAGSDLAALSTKATEVDGGWRINGQKIWTSYAGMAQF